jgi:hypothetical protein
MMFRIARRFISKPFFSSDALSMSS